MILNFACGTCGSSALVLTSTAGEPWKLACENGHPWVLVPGEDVRIEVDLAARSTELVVGS